MGIATTLSKRDFFHQTLRDLEIEGYKMIPIGRLWHKMPQPYTKNPSLHVFPLILQKMEGKITYW